jgi:hypothetical protein
VLVLAPPRKRFLVSKEMQESNDEIARRVLEEVIERLEARGRSGALDANASPALNRGSESPVDGDPVIVVVLGRASLNSVRNQDTRQVLNEASLAGATNGSPASFGNSYHPGLERFALPKTSSNAVAPKTCFMEPDRPCVNSGACEIRGY